MAGKGENRAPAAHEFDDPGRVETLMLADPHEVLAAAGTDPEPNTGPQPSKATRDDGRGAGSDPTVCSGRLM